MARRRGIGFGYMAIALIFLFNPNIAVIDIFPDFVGYIFLCIAFSKLADMNDTVDMAITSFRKMILVDIGKWLSLLWIFGLAGGSERNTSVLLWTFVFSVLEIIFLVPAYSKLFAGITELGYFYENTAIFGDTAKGKKKTPTDRMRALTIAFVIAKAVLTVLPEFADLTNSMYDEGSSVINLYQYIGLLRSFAVLLVMIFGLVWLVCGQVYFGRLFHDKRLVTALCSGYETKVLPKKGLFVKRTFRTSTLLLLIGLILTADFRINSQNLLPDTFAAVALLVALIVLRRRINVKIGAWLSLDLIYLGSTVLTAVAEYYFFSEFYYGAIYKSEMAMVVYNAVLICNLLQLALFIGLLVSIIRAICQVVDNHTGSVEGREQNGIQEKKMAEDVQRELRHSLWYGMIGAGVYVVADVAYLILAPSYGFMSMIHIACAALCVYLFGKAFSSIQTAIETKYMLE